MAHGVAPLGVVWRRTERRRQATARPSADSSRGRPGQVVDKSEKARADRLLGSDPPRPACGGLRHRHGLRAPRGGVGGVTSQKGISCKACASPGLWLWHKCPTAAQRIPTRYR